jgi:hypothetical protein
MVRSAPEAGALGDRVDLLELLAACGQAKKKKRTRFDD